MADTAQDTPEEKKDAEAQEAPEATAPAGGDAGVELIEPDLDFVRAVGKLGGESFKKCFQCATCSATCELSPDASPFPRKEMAWAAWGMKDKLVNDPDIWLCYQCGDCTDLCPRGARPGDVLAALRQQCVQHYAVPGFLGKWVNQPKFFALLVLIPVVLLGLAIRLRGPIENALGIAKETSEKIVFSYSNLLPHWLLMPFFFLFTILAALAVIAGVMRFWRAMKSAGEREGLTAPAKELGPSIVSALKSIFTHDKFTQCTANSSRFVSHLCVFYGFLALLLVTMWVMISSWNPLLRSAFAYPFSFWNPWRILGNLGGAAIVVGCLLMIRDRWLNTEDGGTHTFFDWAFVGTILAVVLTGFATEALHYLRVDPHRHLVYFIHLVCVFVLIMYFPYSKFAHIVYRTTAMVYAEYSGRDPNASDVAAGDGEQGEEAEAAQAEQADE